MNNILLVKPITGRVSGGFVRQMAVCASAVVMSLLPFDVTAQTDSPLPTASESSADQVQTDQDVQNDGASSDAVADENAKPTIIVTRSACQQLVRHVPDDDVTYQPGVDVYGNKVAPADLNGGSAILKSLPKEIEFPVTIDFFEYAGITKPRGVGGEQSIGKISFRNGRVYFNDQPLGDDAVNAEVIGACSQAGSK